jgi:hypothetical protein
MLSAWRCSIPPNIHTLAGLFLIKKKVWILVDSGHEGYGENTQ